MTTIQETKRNLSEIFESMTFAKILQVREAYVHALIACDESKNTVATGLMAELLNYVDCYLSMLARLIDDGWEGEC
jgi:hypothetical protein